MACEGSGGGCDVTRTWGRGRRQLDAARLPPEVDVQALGEVPDVGHATRGEPAARAGHSRRRVALLTVAPWGPCLPAVASPSPKDGRPWTPGSPRPRRPRARPSPPPCGSP